MKWKFSGYLIQPKKVCTLEQQQTLHHLVLGNGNNTSYKSKLYRQYGVVRKN